MEVEKTLPNVLQAHPFAPGHFVVGGAWVGRVDAIEHHVTIAFDNGMVAKVGRWQLSMHASASGCMIRCVCPTLCC